MLSAIAFYSSMFLILFLFFLLCRMLEDVQKAYDHLYEEGFHLPYEVSGATVPSQLISGENISKTLIFMGRRRKQAERDWVLKIARRVASRDNRMEKLKERRENSHIDYSLMGNSIMLRMYDRDIDKNLNWKVRILCVLSSQAIFY